MRSDGRAVDELRSVRITPDFLDLALVYVFLNFITTIASDDISNPSGETNYKSPNTDLLGWVAERASGRSLRDFMADIVKAAE